MCKSQQHIDMLEQFYNNIVEALKGAASEVLINSPKQKHNLPRWNKDVREKHKAARRAYLYWIDNHKPKSGPVFDIMKESKKEFKYTSRACRKSQQKCKDDAMAEALWNRSPKHSGRKSEKARNHGFHLQWEVKQEIKQSVSCGENTSALLNSSRNCEIGTFVHQNIISHVNFEGIDELMCNSFKIKSLLHKLPLNCAAGKDVIFAEHILYADSSVCNHLSSLFNMCSMHGKFPQECMPTVIAPICKNKNGNISDAGNYRPVSLATIISKLFELNILSCISPLLATTDNQFGFKPKHGTDMCIFLQQTVSYYVNKDTPVFSAFLDASKAFDRTNHNLLFGTGNRLCK